MLIIVAILIVPMSYALSSWVSEITPVCQDNICLESTQAVYRMKVINTGNEPLSFDRIVFTDDMNFIIGDRRLKDMNIGPNKSVIIDVPGVISAPTKGSLMYYVVNYIIGNMTYQDKIRAMRVMPLDSVECVNDDYCDDDEMCSGYMCVPKKVSNMTNSSMVKRCQKYERESYSNIYTNVILSVIALLLLAVFLKK